MGVKKIEFYTWYNYISETKGGMKSIFIFRKKCFRKFVSYKKCQKKFFREKGNSVTQVVNSACARKVR